jgi:poly(3-hydroxybutyrate) depolymerase
VQKGVGHYGVFNGSRFRSEIVPRISDFVLSNNYAVGRNGAKRVTKTKLALEAGNGSAPATAAPAESRR